MQKKSSDEPYYGIFSLTYSDANFTALDGLSRPGTYDQKWITNFTAGYIFNEKWEVSLKFRFATRSPFTPFDNNGNQDPLNYNSERFDPLHTLDLRVDRRWDFGGWNLITYLDVQNVYNRKNQNEIRWNEREQKIDDNDSIGLLPSIGVSIEF